MIARCDPFAGAGAGCEFSLALPSDETLQRVFLHCNWAAFIAPDQFDRLDQRTPSHLPATWYDGDNHKVIVDQVVEIVMGNMQVPQPVLAGLEWSVNEITDNVLNHAESPIPGLVQVVTQPARQRITFVVADAGRGILASMREGFPGHHVPLRCGGWLPLIANYLQIGEIEGCGFASVRRRLPPLVSKTFPKAGVLPQPTESHRHGGIQPGFGTSY